MKTIAPTSILCIFSLFLFNSVIAQSTRNYKKGNRGGVVFNENSSFFEGFLPVKQLHYTSPYGLRYHPVLAKEVMHNGVDLKAHFCPVHAFASGTVKKVAFDKRSGIYIVISHTERLESVYCHLSRIRVFPGETVRGNTIIATSGATGMVTGPHLHFALKLDGHYINPKPILALISAKSKAFVVHN